MSLGNRKSVPLTKESVRKTNTAEAKREQYQVLDLGLSASKIQKFHL